MSKQHATQDKRPQKKPAKPKPAVAEANLNQAELVQIPGIVNNATIQAQGERIGDPRLQRAQKEALARQIGHAHGNQHLQRVLQTLRPPGKETGGPEHTQPEAPLQTGVISRWEDEGPYTPGDMSQRYHELPPKEKAEVNAEVDRRFQAETGVTRKLDPKNPKDLALVRKWLRIRDAVMTKRVTKPDKPPEPKKPEPEKPEPEKPKPEKPKPEPPKTGLSYEEAKKKIEAAGKGWGTDEAAIYDAIRKCSERDKLKADASIQKLLKDEMSGHDLWKAQLLLEFGSESAFPEPIKEIWSATKGWGTDEKRIFEALQKLDGPTISRISKIPGLKDMLKSELSGKDLKASNDLLAGDYAKAIDRHKANVAEMATQINNMRTGTLIERNTAEWLVPTSPGAKPKNDLHVCTLTHDAEARAKEHGHEKDYQTYFGAIEKFPDNSSTYDAHIKSKRNIRFVKKNTGGHHLNKDIWIYEPKSQGASGVKILLIHEVQHDADRHDEEHGHGGSGPAEVWNRYKTEFRAYWQDGRYNSTSAAHNPGLAPWDNARQKIIFDNMVASGIYEWLKKNYDDDSAKIDGKKFKDLVHSYTKPEGVNLQNSPRIDDFYLSLDKCKKSHTDLTKDPLKALETAAKQLNAHDQAQVNSADAARLQEMMKANLAATVLPHIAKIVNGGTLPGWAKSK